MAVKEDLEHGAETLGSVMAPELLRQVSRRGSGDEVTCSLGARVLTARAEPKLGILNFFPKVDARKLSSKINSSYVHTCANITC